MITSMSDYDGATTPRPAAPWVGTGLVLTLLAPLALAVGAVRSMTWSASVYATSDPGAPFTIVGAVLAIVGTVVLAVGVFRLAEHVDRLGGVRYRDGGRPLARSDDEAERQAAARRALADGQ